MRSAKRGRPKDNRPKVDLGTPELRGKRKAALAWSGSLPRANWPPPEAGAAESELGRLLWRGILHADYAQGKRMHDAGVMFCGWWVLVYPKTFTQGTLGRFQPGGSMPVDTETAEANLKSASAFLAKERSVLDAVINAAVYQRVNPRELEKLRTGLCRLMEWQKKGRRVVPQFENKRC